MDIGSDLPVWLTGLTWLAAVFAGVLAIAALTRTLEAVFDLDRG